MRLKTGFSLTKGFTSEKSLLVVILNIHLDTIVSVTVSKVISSLSQWSRSRLQITPTSEIGHIALLSVSSRFGCDSLFW